MLVFAQFENKYIYYLQTTGPLTAVLHEAISHLKQATKSTVRESDKKFVSTSTQFRASYNTTNTQAADIFSQISPNIRGNLIT